MASQQMADSMELDSSGSHHSMSPESSPTSSPPSSPPVSPRSVEESQPQRECRELLTDPDGTNLFRAYLKGAYASEVLNLWIEIQLYKKLEEQDKLRKKGHFIFDKYCKEGDSEVNIDESLRLAVKQAIDNNTMECTTFNNIQIQVFDLLWTDCFMGFRHTDTYHNYITQKNNKPVTPQRRTTLSAGTHLTDYMSKIKLLTNRKSLTESQQNLRTYFTHIKKAAPLK